MDFLNRIVTAAFDTVLHPFGQLSPIWGLAFISVVTGVVLVWLFGKISNQQRVRILKSSMNGHLLEVWIFRDQLRNVLRAERSLFWKTGKYLLCSLPAFCVLMIPALIVMVQLQARYGCQPLHPGGHVLLKVFAQDASTDRLADLQIRTPDGLIVETPPLRISQTSEVDFRIGAERPGNYPLTLEANGISVTKSLDVGSSCCATVSAKRGGNLWDRFGHPLESNLPRGVISAVEVAYPTATVPVGPFQVSWIWPFLLISMAVGYALKGVLRVEL
jgi:hypothetical protein